MSISITRTVERPKRQEVAIYLLVWILYLLAPAYTPSKTSTALDLGYFIQAFNHFASISFILFVLIPASLHQAKYAAFTLWTTILILTSTFIEEMVLEPILYPEGSGSEINLYDVWHSVTQFIPTVVIFIAFKMIWDAKERVRKVEELKKEKALTELNFLKSQLNPHLLFNTITSIYSEAMDESPKTAKMILKLSSLMRYLLKKSTSKVVPLQAEVEQVDNFISLQKLRTSDYSDISFKVSGDLSNISVAPALLLSIVENCFKHSFNSENLRIHIDLIVEGQKLTLATENSIGNTEGDSNKIGMENINKQLELQYPDLHHLDINTSDGTHNLKLQINLENERD